MNNTLVCIAMGGSLTEDILEEIKLSGHDTFVLNEMFRTMPDATYHYAADRPWWELHGDELVETFNGQIFTIWEDIAKKYGVTYIDGENKQPDSRGGLRQQDPDFRSPYKVYHGGTSIHTAGSLGYWMGYNRIVFVACDCKPNGHFLKHEERLPNLWKSSPYEQWAINMKDLFLDLDKRGVQVCHVSDDSAIDWPTMNIEEALYG